MREIQRIFIHCTAGSQKQTKKDLLNEFKAKGWKAPGYHYVVFPDGKIEQLLDESKVSNGVQGYNSTSINVAYVGGIDSRGRATDNRSEAQKASLRTLLEGLKKRYPNFEMVYEPEPIKQAIADSWPDKMDDSCARNEWGWSPQYDLEKMTDDMILNLKKKLL